MCSHQHFDWAFESIELKCAFIQALLLLAVGEKENVWHCENIAILDNLSQFFT